MPSTPTSKMPALPKPSSIQCFTDYTADEMLAYGQACRDAALEEVKADTVRLNAVEAGLLFVEPQYQAIPATWAVGKAGMMTKGKTLRAAIDAALKGTQP